MCQLFDPIFFKKNIIYTQIRKESLFIFEQSKKKKKNWPCSMKIINLLGVFNSEPLQY